MKSADHIVILDPALQNHQGEPSSNLGDLIISEAVGSLIKEIFPQQEIHRISSHDFLSREHRNLIKAARFSFIGGSNLLYSDMITYRQLALRRGKLLWLFPGIKNLILLGCGWGPDFNNKMTTRTAILYNNILHPGLLHAVRDKFTADKIESETRRKTINTSCPSMWGLSVPNSNLDATPTDCLFSLTDYRQDSINDENLVKTLLDYFSSLHFFPQGKGDLAYLQSLDIYKKNSNKITLLPHDYSRLKEFIRAKSFVYIGTRLHGGIKCLELGRKALIIAVDNRAKEIANDTHLPVIGRNEFDKLEAWLRCEPVFKNVLRVPKDKIEQWKKQFVP